MKLEVNLKQNPYDIIIEKGALKGVGQWVKSLWEPQKIAPYYGQSCGRPICRKS